MSDNNEKSLGQIVSGMDDARWNDPEYNDTIHRKFYEDRGVECAVETLKRAGVDALIERASIAESQVANNDATFEMMQTSLRQQLTLSKQRESKARSEGVTAGKLEALAYTPEEREIYGKWAASNGWLRESERDARIKELEDALKPFAGNLTGQPYVWKAQEALDPTPLEGGEEKLHKSILNFVGTPEATKLCEDALKEHAEGKCLTSLRDEAQDQGRLAAENLSTMLKTQPEEKP